MLNSEVNSGQPVAGSISISVGVEVMIVYFHNTQQTLDICSVATNILVSSWRSRAGLDSMEVPASRVAEDTSGQRCLSASVAKLGIYKSVARITSVRAQDHG